MRSARRGPVCILRTDLNAICDLSSTASCRSTSCRSILMVWRRYELPEDSLFHKLQIRDRVEVDWGGYSIAEAERRLLIAALQVSLIQHVACACSCLHVAPHRHECPSGKDHQTLKIPQSVWGSPSYRSSVVLTCHIIWLRDRVCMSLQLFCDEWSIRRLLIPNSRLHVQDPLNQRFAVLSEAGIPLYSPSVVWLEVSVFKSSLLQITKGSGVQTDALE